MDLYCTQCDEENEILYDVMLIVSKNYSAETYAKKVRLCRDCLYNLESMFFEGDLL